MGSNQHTEIRMKESVCADGFTPSGESYRVRFSAGERLSRGQWSVMYMSGCSFSGFPPRSGSSGQQTIEVGVTPVSR